MIFKMINGYLLQIVLLQQAKACLVYLIIDLSIKLEDGIIYKNIKFYFINLIICSL
jgi:hypothetical protein